MISNRRVVIDCGATRAAHYGPGWAVVAVDVFRATTTACTALVSGRRCFPVASRGQAWALARQMPTALLAGELGGHAIAGFEASNSPAEMASRTDVERPLILLSTSGTQLLCAPWAASAVYAACLRNTSAQVRHLAETELSVAVIGAGSLGQFREEDQFGTARIAAGLANSGFTPDERAQQTIDRWGDAPVTSCLTSRSATYLRRSGQSCDIDFTLAHIDDVSEIFLMVGGELEMVRP